MSLNITPDQIANLLASVPPENRLAVMRPLLRGKPASFVWPVMLEWFPYRDDIWPHHRWLRPMLVRAGNAYPYMRDSEQKAFDALDVEQWVVRGAQSAHKCGLSWTTNRGAAEYYARMHTDRSVQGHVYEAMIAKRDIFAVWQGDPGPTILLRNTELYEVNRVDSQKSGSCPHLSFKPSWHYYDDNNDRKTAELRSDPAAREALEAADTRLSVWDPLARRERTARLPPVENMAQRNLLARLAQIKKELEVYSPTENRARLLREQVRLEAEKAEREAGAKPGRVETERGGAWKGWGAKGKSPGRTPIAAMKPVTLPVLTRLLSSANVGNDNEDDETA